MSAETRYWFRAKRYGWGWGLPCSWQGWVFFLIWLGALLGAAIRLMPRASVSIHHGIDGHDGPVRCDLLPQRGATLGWIQDSLDLPWTFAGCVIR